jgi:hypothetical protein
VFESIERDSQRALSDFLDGNLSEHAAQIQNLRTETKLSLWLPKSEIEQLKRFQGRQLSWHGSLEPSITHLRSEIQEFQQVTEMTDGDLEWVWKSIYPCGNDLGAMDKVIANDDTRELFSQWLKSWGDDRALPFYVEVQEYTRLEAENKRRLRREFQRISGIRSVISQVQHEPGNK